MSRLYEKICSKTSLEKTYDFYYMFNGHEYICNKCGKMYMHRGSLQRHSKFECGVTPKFGCGFCGRRFSQRSNLSRHVVDIHRSALEEFINKRSESRNEDDLILQVSNHNIM
ncbi:putative zinc finger protein 840 [Rhopalosiphum padi]|uniref:putative zinc finger protein 840 n=1 Tax=Rhopalosiphum padi TaxID=40932 RepID=UPI00298E8964|nr:putative zinc finger protein 840 [Rhopalosiphum padi]